MRNSEGETETMENRKRMKTKEVVEYIDSPEVKPELILDILQDFKNKTPGPSGITRDFLLKAHFNFVSFPSLTLLINTLLFNFNQQITPLSFTLLLSYFSFERSCVLMFLGYFSFCLERHERFFFFLAGNNVSGLKEKQSFWVMQ